MKKLKIVCTIVIIISLICASIISLYPFEVFVNYLKYANLSLVIDSFVRICFHCLCALIVFATLIFLLIVLWKSDLEILMESIAEKDKAKRKAAKQAKLQREIAEKTAQLEELNNQPSGEENGE